MGASQFFTTAKGHTADEAFRSAQAEARHEHGHGGYTGTVAEKRAFRTFDADREASALKRALEAQPEDDFATKVIHALDVLGAKRAHAVAEAMLLLGDPRVDDKWGPAGCVRVDAETWLFFGWASC